MFLFRENLAAITFSLNIILMDQVSYFNTQASNELRQVCVVCVLCCCPFVLFIVLMQRRACSLWKPFAHWLSSDLVVE